MGNLIFNSKTRESIKLSNGATHGIVKGIVIAGSHLAKTNWQKELIFWFAERDQNIVGNGLIGFSINSLGWHKGNHLEQKEFLLEVLNFALKNKSWNNFNFSLYDDRGAEYLQKLIEMIINLKVEDLQFESLKFAFTSSSEISFEYCNKHQVILNGIEGVGIQNCYVCNSDVRNQDINLDFETIEPTEEFWRGNFIKARPRVEFNSKHEILRIVDSICLENNLIALGNLWNEIEIDKAQQFIMNGLSYDLAFPSSKISSDKFVKDNLAKLFEEVQKDKVELCLVNTFGNPWNGSYSSFNLSNEWTFCVCCIVSTLDLIIFTMFVSED